MYFYKGFLNWHILYVTGGDDEESFGQREVEGDMSSAVMEQDLVESAVTTAAAAALASAATKAKVKPSLPHSTPLFSIDQTQKVLSQAFAPQMKSWHICLNGNK